MKLFNYFVRVCFLIACAAGIGKFCQNITDGFSIAAISSNRAHRPEYETRILNEKEKIEVSHALNQPYHYCCSGGQVFVFFSEDGKYALKFFRQRLYRPSWILNHLPLPKILHRYRAKCNWKRKNKLERDFFSYKASFEELKDESALLYCHLNRSTHLNKQIEITDPLKIHHFLNLDHFDFIVQRRVERVYDWISNEPPQTTEVFSQILALIDTCIKKGFNNRDPFIPNNCGLFDNRAILIDVGRFVRDESLRTEEGHAREFKRIADDFESWLETTYPQMLPLFQEERNKVLRCNY